MRINGRDREELYDALKDSVERIGWEKVQLHRTTVSFERFCWDLFFSVDVNWRNDWLESIYASGCEDKHILTALKHSYNLIEQ